MEEIHSIAKRIELNHNDLDAWQRLSALVDDPKKLRDCRDQITRIQNEQAGFHTIIHCDRCGALMQVVPEVQGNPATIVCPVCHQGKELENGGNAVQTGPFGKLLSAFSSLQRGRLTLLAIIFSNLLPIFGILFLGWSMGSVMILYWVENIMVGFFTVLKMAFADAQAGSGMGKMAIIAFFCVHYGLFCTVHGVFIAALFLPAFFRTWNWQALLMELAIPILAMFISYSISFYQNYLKSEGYKYASLTNLMGEPYPRIVPLHMGIILGGFFIMALGSPIGVILVLVALKTGAEVLYYQHSVKKWHSRAIGN
jgi:hypothetical protein